MRTKELYKYKPFMTDREISHLVRYLTREDKMLEVGGGDSTIFFSKLVKNLTTVEHNKNFGLQLIQTIKDLKFTNVKIHIVEPNYPQQHNFQPAQPNQFDNYVGFLQSLSETYDCILIDGRDRVRSTQSVVKNLKVGGFLFIHDFWNRPKYHSVLQHPNLRLIEEDNSFHKIGDDTLVVFEKIS